MNRAAEVNSNASSVSPLDDLYRLVASEFDQVNALIPNQLTSDVAMVEEIANTSWRVAVSAFARCWSF